MKRQPDPAFRVFAAAVISVAFLILVGYTMLLFTKPTELDKQCLGKSLNEIRECISEYQQKD
jgi:hypothetical protein